jgi:hypothetical protein
MGDFYKSCISEVLGIPEEQVTTVQREFAKQVTFWARMRSVITVQTGLNNLVYFADEVWLENPACNPVVYRQAVGRVDRIGQKKPTSIMFPLYQGTSQVDLIRSERSTRSDIEP